MREIDTNNCNMWAWVSVCVCVCLLAEHVIGFYFIEFITCESAFLPSQKGKISIELYYSSVQWTTIVHTYVINLYKYN